jgi:hypothetical protein
MSSTLTIAGVDPGIAGGVAVFSGGRIVFADRLPVREIAVGRRVRRMTDGAALGAILAEYRPDAVYVEEAHARTSRGRRGRDGDPQGDSAPTAFSFGGNWAIVVDRASEYGLVLVSPRQWQRAMLVLPGGRGDRDATKAAAIAFVKAFHPEVDLAPGRLREPHDGIADAVAICVFGHIQESGINPPPRTIRRAANNRRRP